MNLKFLIKIIGKDNIKPQLVKVYDLLMQLSHTKCKEVVLEENEVGTHILLISEDNTEKCYPFVVTMDADGNIIRKIERLNIEELINNKLDLNEL
jgi:hypothetical protein